MKTLPDGSHHTGRLAECAGERAQPVVLQQRCIEAGMNSSASEGIREGEEGRGGEGNGAKGRVGKEDK